jgi:hypothetical protein
MKNGFLFLFISDLEFLINVLEGRVKSMQRGYFLMYKSKKQMKNRIRQLKKKIYKLEKRIIDLDYISFWCLYEFAVLLLIVGVAFRLTLYLMLTLNVLFVDLGIVAFMWWSICVSYFWMHSWICPVKKMFQRGLCFIPPGRENTGIFTGPFSRSLSWILAFEINKSIPTSWVRQSWQKCWNKLYVEWCTIKI